MEGVSHVYGDGTRARMDGLLGPNGAGTSTPMRFAPVEGELEGVAISKIAQAPSAA